MTDSSFLKAFFAATIPLVLVSALDKDIQLFLDGGSQIEFEVVSDASFNNSSGTLQPLTVTGYLLDCIAVRCAPIVH